ncbi:MAG: hypothetical protein M3315_09750 [Actinomycetota bacterium]|nr:hypothetical protein [Actinomycetota bacterium]
MQSVVYVVEVYYPKSRKDVFHTFESSSPFMAIGQGDLLDPSEWSGAWSPIRFLQVVQVVHVLREKDEQIVHKAMVYTEESLVFEAAEE